MAMSVSPAFVELAPQTGAALRLPRGHVLTIADPQGEQVADVALFAADDPRESFSAGITIDYNASVVVRLGAMLYSNRGEALASVVEDTTGVHDILLAPCSAAMFARRGELGHRSCLENLSNALRPFSIDADDVRATINVFMNVRVEPDGGMTIEKPASRAGDVFAIRALRDLIVGISACSSELTNNGRCKPIAYSVQ
jgi:uncharacterized protein